MVFVPLIYECARNRWECSSKVDKSGHLHRKGEANISVLVGIDTPSFRTLYGEILEGFVRGVHLTPLKPGGVIRA